MPIREPQKADAAHRAAEGERATQLALKLAVGRKGDFNTTANPREPPLEPAADRLGGEGGGN